MSVTTMPRYRGPEKTAPQAEAEDPREWRGGAIAGFVYALAFEAWIAAMAFGVYFIWHHWK